MKVMSGRPISRQSSHLPLFSLPLVFFFPAFPPVPSFFLSSPFLSSPFCLSPKTKNNFKVLKQLLGDVSKSPEAPPACSPPPLTQALPVGSRPKLIHPTEADSQVRSSITMTKFLRSQPRLRAENSVEMATLFCHMCLKVPFFLLFFCSSSLCFFFVLSFRIRTYNKNNPNKNRT